MTTTLLPAIGYIRVGSPDPKTLVGEFQKRRLTEWAAATGHEITEWVEEFGVGRAGPAFDKAVAGCRGKAIVATAPDRISRHLARLREQSGRVRAVGGRLAFVESWPGTDPLLEMAIELATASTASEELRAAVYRRRPAVLLDADNQQRQVAAVWDVAEEAGAQVEWIDGAELGRDPRELLDKD